MAQILISEPDDHVRRLLARMVARLGHEPVTIMVPTPQHLTSTDVFVVEPAAPVGAVFAQAASIADPSLPLICVSVSISSAPALTELGVVFVASLVKPFTLEQLGAAIERALLERPACRGRRLTHDTADEDHGQDRAA
jgi:DNA-binding NtrC family response regulator